MFSACHYHTGKTVIAQGCFACPFACFLLCFPIRYEKSITGIGTKRRPAGGQLLRSILRRSVWFLQGVPRVCSACSGTVPCYTRSFSPANVQSQCPMPYILLNILKAVADPLPDLLIRKRVVQDDGDPAYFVHVKGGVIAADGQGLLDLPTVHLDVDDFHFPV